LTRSRILMSSDLVFPLRILDVMNTCLLGEKTGAKTPQTSQAQLN